MFKVNGNLLISLLIELVEGVALYNFVSVTMSALLQKFRPVSGLIARYGQTRVFVANYHEKVPQWSHYMSRFIGLLLPR